MPSEFNHVWEQSKVNSKESDSLWSQAVPPSGSKFFFPKFYTQDQKKKMLYWNGKFST